MMMATMPGQTVFIAQFNASLRSEFGLSHGAFGGLYTSATLISTTALVFAGVLADRVRLRRLNLASVVGLAATTLRIWRMNGLPHLVVALGLLRFCGQGMLSHVSMTAIARWFNRFRSRAISLAALGFTIGEAMLPFGLTLAIATAGWRNVWMATGLVLVALFVPLLLHLLRDAPDGRRALAAGHVNPDVPPDVRATGAGWTRARVLRDPLFWALVPGIMGPPAIATLFIFQQTHLAEPKGWPLTTFTAFYPVLAVSGVAASLTAGVLVDRLRAWRLMPLCCSRSRTPAWSWGRSRPCGPSRCCCSASGCRTASSTPWWARSGSSSTVPPISARSARSWRRSSWRPRRPGPGLAGALIDAGIELDGQAGQAVSISGLCAVVAGLIVTSLMGRLDRRLVLIGMALLLAVAGTLVSLAPNFLVLMIGCALLGIPIGGFWSLNTPVLMRLLPVALVPLGLATGQGGTALAGAVAAPWAAPWAT